MLYACYCYFKLQNYHFVYNFVGNVVNSISVFFSKISDWIIFSVICGDPGPVRYGRQIASDGNFYMSSLRFFCIPGYKLVGNDRITCQKNKTWSGVPPKCYGKLTVVWVQVDGGQQNYLYVKRTKTWVRYTEVT